MVQEGGLQSGEVLDLVSQGKTSIAKHCRIKAGLTQETQQTDTLQHC